MEYAIKLLEEKVDIITHNLREYIHLKSTKTWRELNAKKRDYKRAISILKDGNKNETQNDSELPP